MATETGCLTRRILLGATFAGASGLALGAHAAPTSNDEAVAWVKALTGRQPILSARLHLVMPPAFPTGSIVPLTLRLDSPMTAADHVKRFDVIAPENPIVEVASFHFTPERSEARVATRIRLAAPQSVIALADMSDGTLLMTTAWVEVATDGCS